jgi:hypothetical protein
MFHKPGMLVKLHAYFVRIRSDPPTTRCAWQYYFDCLDNTAALCMPSLSFNRPCLYKTKLTACSFLSLQH